ncbi:MgtC/SapB family protein [Paenibacillus alba]|uniref:MgtC/SapB family protein n=1 Tax=Paenibacillus alba TaxID=1197127 RepID=A0ABU6G9Z9_9BACL|nr:MgtC/SapB family protein [Paenibacillus alba]MEC0229554.1 MgtC/SapB family protein [Paenibacillus alba]NQX71396.1 MgtC/SapB family protein [Paenibacillus alba]
MPLVSNPAIWHIDYWELTFRLVLALVLGGLVGFEREMGGHSAGFRTHILVCIGSTMIVLLSMYGFAEFANEPNVRLDPARLAAQVISGIGFLGAGTIMRNGFSVSGLTTAASLWVVAAIGLSVGAGFYFGASVATALVVICLFFLNKLESVFSKSKTSREILLNIEQKTARLHHIIDQMNGYGIRIHKIVVENENNPTSEEYVQLVKIRMQIKIKQPKRFEEALMFLTSLEGVQGLETVSFAS